MNWSIQGSDVILCPEKQPNINTGQALGVWFCTNPNSINQSIKFIVIREAWLPNCPSQRLMFKT